MLILASQSPRRRELLSRAGYQFTVIPPSESAECGACSGETPAQLVERLARQKALDVANRLREQSPAAEGIVLGCDTVAACNGRILGKPRDEQHARQMLRMLRGCRHHVYSGVCLIQLPDQAMQTGVAVTTLEMLPLPDAEIEEYVASGLWEGKAGGFGLQDRTGWIEIVEGSESNVVGLPLELLAELLAR
jgi:septum formation protein